MKIILNTLIAFLTAVQCCFAQENVSDFANVYNKVQADNLNLYDVIQQGGIVMIVLGVLSIVAFALILFNFFQLRITNFVSAEFNERLITSLEKGDLVQAKKDCLLNKSLISKMALLGFDKKTKGAVIARETMESYVQARVSKLWQGIGYLADIGSVAPLIGLLGTVIGMIQAFNVIAFDTAVVKPALLAGGVSKAMITTAGGLIVAIPVILFYSYFKGRVQTIVHEIESHATDVIELIASQSRRNIKY